MAKTTGFDWKITAKKVAINAAYVIVVGILSVYADNPYVLAALPLLVGIENWLKHRKG